MEPSTKLLALCALLVPLALAVPLRDYNDYYDDNHIDDRIDDGNRDDSSAAVQWQTTQCARHQCLHDNSLVRFDKGKTYFYSLRTDTQIQASDYEQPQLVQLEAQVMVSAHSDCEMSLQLTHVALKGLNDDQEYARALQSQPLHFGYSDGLVTDVCPHQSSSAESAWIVNVQKSVLSALQMSARSLQSESVVMETDIVGQCETVYRPTQQRFATSVITKTKQLNKCANRQKAQIGLFPRSYGNSIFQNMPVMNASYTCQQTIDKDLIVGATCRERQQLRGTQVAIDSQLNLRFERQQKGLEVVRTQAVMKRGHLLMSARAQAGRETLSGSESDIQELLRVICQQLSSERKSDTLETFPKLIEHLSRSQQSTVDRVAKSVFARETCQSSQLEDLLLDASAQSGSEAGLAILMDAYEAKRISGERSAFLFSLMAFSSEPSDKAVKKAVEFVTSRDLPKHVILGVSALIHNARHFPKNSQKEVETQARHALAQLEKRAKEEKQDSTLIGLIKAMENIGLDLSVSARQLLVEMATNQRQSSQSVRVAALKALTDSGLESQQRQKVMEVLARESEDNEVRIEAYKAVVMSGADKQQLEAIKALTASTRNLNVQQYVRAHQHNLRQTSDPHKMHVLAHDAPEFEKPTKQWFGISNHFESSFMLDALSVGVAFEADVIHSESEKEIPRALTLNATIPAFGRELQLLEVNVRQKGFSRVIADQIRKVQQKTKDQDWLSTQALQQLLQVLANAHQWTNEVNGEDVELEVNVKVDGKTVWSEGVREIRNNANHWMTQLKAKLSNDHVTVDRALAVQALNTRITIPTQNGFPVTVRVNATILASLKASAKMTKGQSSGLELDVAPAFGLQFESGVEFSLNRERKAVEMVARVSSQPQWKSSFEARDSRIANLKVFAEKQKQNILTIEKRFYRTNAQNRREEVVDQHQEQRWCSEKTRKPFGIEFCAKRSNNVYELSLEKSDSRLKSFDFSVESPPKSAREMQNYRIAFNTPNSDVDREMSAELTLAQPSANSGRGEVKLALRSPWARWSASAQMRNEDKELSVKVDMEANGKKQFSADVGLESQTRGQKREYRPRVRIEYGESAKAIEMQGSVSVSKGRKNQLQINLEGNQKQFLKGSFVREGERKSNDLRLSSDLTLSLPGLELRLNALGDKGVKHMMSDVTLEYRFEGRKKESVKWSTKVQNLTQSQMTKMSAFAEMTSTEFPSLANFHVAYNLLRKPNEHVENEVTVAWKQQLKDKIHVLHVSKRTQQSDKAFKVENTLDVEATPFGLNYELRANADVKQGDQYQVELVGKDRTGRKENDVRGTLLYKHVSRAPLHLTMEAVLKTSGRELKYTDQLREVADGEYKGDTSVQYGPGQKATLEYNYKQKPGMHHEIDMQLQMPGQPPIKHQGLLRMSRDEFEVKSKVNAFGRQLLDTHALLNNKRESRLALQLNNDFEAKVHVNPHVIPALASWQITKGALSHMTNVEMVPKNSFSLKSDTKNSQRNVFAVDSHVSRYEPSRIIVTSEPINGRLNFDLNSDRQMGANLEINSASGDWKHASEVALKPTERVVVIKSQTQSLGAPVYTLDSQWSRAINKPSFVKFDARDLTLSADADVFGARAKSANWEVDWKKQWNHKTNMAVDRDQLKIQSLTKQRDGTPLADVQMLVHQKSKVANLKSRFGQNLQFDADLKHRKIADDDLVAPYLTISAQNQHLQHNSKLTFDANNWIAESKTVRKNDGQNVLDVNAKIARALNRESELSYQTPSVRSVLKTTPSQSVDFEWNCPQVNHVTSAQWKRANGNAREFGLESKSQWKTSRALLNVSAKHLLKQSFIQTQNALFDARAEMDNSDGERKRVRVEYKANSASPLVPQFQHVTVLERVPSQQVYTWQSSTQSPRGLFLQTDGEYAHQWNAPSTLGFKYSRDGEAKMVVDPVQKSASVEWKSAESAHKSDLEWSPDSVTVKSRSDSSRTGANINKIDSYLTLDPERKSHFSLNSPQYSSQIELEPKKRLNVEFTTSPVQHKTEIQVRNGRQWEIASQTKRNDENVFDLNSSLNFAQKVGKIAVNARDFQHNSELNENELNSKSVYKNQLIHDLRARVLNNEINEKRLDLETPFFETNAQLARDSASLDFKSRLDHYKRHLLAQIRLNDGFHAELAWDLDRDQNQRIVLDARSAKTSYSQNQQIYDLSAAYAGNELRLGSEMTRGQLVNGPHAFTVQYTPAYNAQRDAIGVQFKHVIVNGKQMQCDFVYTEGQKQKFSAKLNSKMDNNDDKNELSIALVTIAPTNPDLEIDVTFNENHSSLRRSDAQMFAELKAVKAFGKQYLFRSSFKKSDEGKISGQVLAETPASGQQRIDVELDVNSRANQLTISAFNRNAKQLEISASAHNTALEFELKSNNDRIASVKAHAQYVPNQVLSATLDLDAERAIDLSIEKSGQSADEGVQLSAKLFTSFAPKIEIKNVWKWNSRQLLIDSSAIFNLQPIYAAKITADRSANVWSGSAQVSAQGAELGRASLSSDWTQNSLKYVFDANANHVTPIHATFATETMGSLERKVSLKVCSEDQKCFDLKTDVKMQRLDNGLRVPEKVWLSLTKMGTNLEIKASLLELIKTTSADSSAQSLLGLTQDQAIHERLRNQLLVAINGHSLGFEHVITCRDSDRHAIDSLFTFSLPTNQRLELKTDFARIQNTIRMNNEFRIDARDSEPSFDSKLVIDRKWTNNGQNREYSARVEVNSAKFKRNPKSIEIECKSEKNRFSNRIVIDLAQDQNQAITILTQGDQKTIQSSSSWMGASAQFNRTLEVSLSTRDKRAIDLKLFGHVSPKTIGILYKNNVNRNGQKREGLFFAQRLPNNRFEAIARNDEKAYKVLGAFGKSARELSTDLEILNEKSGEKRELRVAIDRQCVKWETKKELAIRVKNQICLNLDNDRHTRLSYTQDNQLDFDLQLDSQRDQQVRLGLKWAPAVLERWLKNARDGNRFDDSYDDMWRRLSQTLADNELLREMSHKYSVVARQLNDDFLIPILTAISDNFGDVFQEFVSNFNPLRTVIDLLDRLSRAIEQKWIAFSDALPDHVIPTPVANVWRSAMRGARKQCKRSEMCFKAIYALENYGYESLSDLFYSNAFSLLKQAHNIIITTQGAMVARMPALPYWLRDLYDEYRQSLRQTIQSIIESNDALNRVVTHAQTVWREMVKESQSEIDWPRIKQALKQIAEVLFRGNYSARVVHWEPRRGSLEVEFSSPQMTSRSIRSLLEKSSQQMKKSMF